MKKKEYNIENSPFFSKIIRTRTTLSEVEQGEGIDLVVARKRHFKQDEYTKCITSESYDINEYHKLSTIAKTILQYIIHDCLEYNSCTFRFKASSFALILKIDKSVVFRGLNDLINTHLIAKTHSKEVYWINHNKYYKGNFIVDKYLKEK